MLLVACLSEIVTIAVGKVAEEEDHQMYLRRMVKQALTLGLLVTIVVLALSACKADEWQRESKARPLPEDPTALYPGDYRSEEFEPSLSFRVVEGWSNVPLEASDVLQIARGEKARLTFTNVEEVYKPTKTGTPNVVETPKDMVGWFRHHPYLQTSKPEAAAVGGVKGVQFDVDVEDPPEDYPGVCHSKVGTEECVDLFRLSTGGTVFLSERSKLRVIVLEDVEGETVTIGLGSPPTEFDEFALEVQRVLESVEWSSS